MLNPTMLNSINAKNSFAVCHFISIGHRGQLHLILAFILFMEENQTVFNQYWMLAGDLCCNQSVALLANFFSRQNLW